MTVLSLIHWYVLYIPQIRKSEFTYGHIGSMVWPMKDLYLIQWDLQKYHVPNTNRHPFWASILSVLSNLIFFSVHSAALFQALCYRLEIHYGQWSWFLPWETHFSGNYIKCDDFYNMMYLPMLEAWNNLEWM